MTWDASLQDIEEALENQSHTVDFSRRPETSTPVGLDWLGRPFPRARRWG